MASPELLWDATARKVRGAWDHLSDHNGTMGRVSESANPSPEEERAQKLLDEFLKLEGKIHARRQMPHYDKQSLLWLFLTLLSLGAAIIIANQSWPWVKALSTLAYCATGLAGGLLVWSLATDVNRFVRQKAYLLLAQGLAPLQPSLGELEEILQACRSENMRVGQRIELQPLCDALVQRGCPLGPASRPHEN